MCSVSNVVSLLDVEDMKNKEERALMLQVSKITEGPPCVPCVTPIAARALRVDTTVHVSADPALCRVATRLLGAPATTRYDRPAPAALRAYVRALRFEPNAPPPPTPLGACHRGLKQLCRELKPSAWKSDVRARAV